jgi:putative membrane protein
VRALSFLFLVAFAGIVGVFAYLNNHSVPVNLFGRVMDVWVPLLAGAVYLLGMLTGWAVVGMLRRSWARVAESDRR